MMFRVYFKILFKSGKTSSCILQGYTNPNPWGGAILKIGKTIDREGGWEKFRKTDNIFTLKFRLYLSVYFHPAEEIMSLSTP